MKTWEYIAFCLMITFLFVAQLGTGIRIGNGECIDELIQDSIVMEAQETLIDALLIESGRDPMYRSEAGHFNRMKQYNEDELFKQENLLDG